MSTEEMNGPASQAESGDVGPICSRVSTFLMLDVVD